MTETSNISSNYNLDAHYTTETKVKKPNLSPADAPVALPSHHLFSDREANKKMAAINNDIYEGAQREKKKKGFNLKLFLTIIAAIGLTILGAKGIKSIIKHFKKS